MDKILSKDALPRCGVEDSCGWLAPDGKFYPCSPRKHDLAADCVYQFVYGKMPRSATVQLEKTGWIRVNDEVCAWRSGIEPTQAQIDTMYELYLIAKDDRKKLSLKWDLEGFGVLMSTVDKGEQMSELEFGVTKRRMELEGWARRDLVDAVLTLESEDRELIRARDVIAALVEQVRHDNESMAEYAAIDADFGVSEWESFMPSCWHRGKEFLKE